MVAPLGGLSRHYLGKWLNSKQVRKVSQPFGTYAANLLGSGLLMAATVIAVEAWKIEPDNNMVSGFFSFDNFLTRIWILWNFDFSYFQIYLC